MRNLGELRSVFASQPSLQGWARVVEVLGAANEDEVRQLIPYLSAHLARWPAPLVEAPLDWLARAASGEEVPQLMLAKTLDASLLLPSELAALAKRGLLNGLIALSARGCGLQTEDLEHWLDAAEHIRPHTLDLSDNYLRDDAIGLLVKSVMASSLRTLVLSRHALSVRGFQRLANSPNLRGLERLVLDHSSIDQAQALALASAAHLPSLKSLSFREATFGVDALRTFIIEGERSQQLEALDLSGAQLVWGEPLALGWRVLPSLKSLSLSSLQFGGGLNYCDQRPYLGHASRMPRLERLAMANIDGEVDELVMAIHPNRYHAVDLGYLGALRTLDLRQNTLRDSSIHHISQDLNFSLLQELELDETLISHDQALMLAESLVLPAHIKARWAAVVDRLTTQGS